MQTQSAPSSTDSCQYPECPAPPQGELCKTHSSPWGRIPPAQRDENLLPNDGFIDWTAVDVAVRGLRAEPLRLTWVEREIAAVIMYRKGEQPQEIEERLGVTWKWKRWQKIRALASDRKAA